MLRVRMCENGYLVLEGDIDKGMPYYGREWVAKSEQELGELVERLAKQERKKKPHDGGSDE